MNELALPKEEWLAVYREEATQIIPLEAVDGYGKIEKLEDIMFQLGNDKVYEFAEWETMHHFSDGVYTRETSIPAGSVITGFRHKQSTVSILASGVISVLGVDPQGHATDYGVLVAPFVVVTPPGIKKIGYAHEDTIFINSFSITELDKKYHNEENMSIIEDYIFDKKVQPCLVSL